MESRYLLSCFNLPNVMPQAVTDIWAIFTSESARSHGAGHIGDLEGAGASGIRATAARLWASAPLLSGNTRLSAAMNIKTQRHTREDRLSPCSLSTTRSAAISSHFLHYKKSFSANKTLTPAVEHKKSSCRKNPMTSTCCTFLMREKCGSRSARICWARSRSTWFINETCPEHMQVLVSQSGLTIETPSPNMGQGPA